MVHGDKECCQLSDSCAAELTCARPDAAATVGAVDVYGVVGAVCSHGIPLLAMFVNMLTSEMFAYYLLLLSELVTQYPAVDFACRLEPAWHKYIALKAMDPALQRSVHLLVNWMHGSSHSMKCQLQNNGRYLEGKGFSVWASRSSSCGP